MSIPSFRSQTRSAVDLPTDGRQFLIEGRGLSRYPVVRCVLVGAGLILLGINAVRSLKSIKMSGFAIVLGVLALVAGLGHLAGVKVPVFAILFIIIGASIILRPLFAKRPS